MFICVCVCIYKYIIFLAVLGLSCGMQDLCCSCRLSCPVACRTFYFPTPGWIHIPCIGRQILNHWAPKEVPVSSSFLRPVLEICFDTGGFFLALCVPVSSVGKETACNAGDPGSIPGSGRPTGEVTGYPLQCSWASLVAQLVKNPPAMWEWKWSRSVVSDSLWPHGL